MARGPAFRRKVAPFQATTDTETCGCEYVVTATSRTRSLPCAEHRQKECNTEGCTQPPVNLRGDCADHVVPYVFPLNIEE